jgi:hypothetical protein
VTWWQWLIAAGVVVFVGWGIGFWMLERRAGTHKSHYSDGCPKPIVEKATRDDGSRKNIIPKPGDGDVDDLEHLLNHKETT